jgi:hypothetical protein
MLDKSFRTVAVEVDTTIQRKCETCSLWQPDVVNPWNPERRRCMCAVPASVQRGTRYSGYTRQSDGSHCMFWNPTAKVNAE